MLSSGVEQRAKSRLLSLWINPVVANKFGLFCLGLSSSDLGLILQLFTNDVVAVLSVLCQNNYGLCISGVVIFYEDRNSPSAALDGILILMPPSRGGRANSAHWMSFGAGRPVIAGIRFK